MVLQISGCLQESHVEDTEPRIALHRKAISERFLQNPGSGEPSRILVFCGGIALSCGTGLGSVAQRSRTASVAASHDRS
jgi:hypothetical protein